MGNWTPLSGLKPQGEKKLCLMNHLTWKVFGGSKLGGHNFLLPPKPFQVGEAHDLRSKGWILSTRALFVSFLDKRLVLISKSNHLIWLGFWFSEKLFVHFKQWRIKRAFERLRLYWPRRLCPSSRRIPTASTTNNKAIPCCSNDGINFVSTNNIFKWCRANMNYSSLAQ